MYKTLVQLLVVALALVGCSPGSTPGLQDMGTVDGPRARDLTPYPPRDTDNDGIPDSNDACPLTPKGLTPDAVRTGCPAVVIINLSNADESTYLLQGLTRSTSLYANEATVDPLTHEAPNNSVTIPFEVTSRPNLNDWVDLTEVVILINVNISGPAVGACVDDYSDAAPDPNTAMGYTCVPRFISSLLLAEDGHLLSAQAIPLPSGFDSREKGNAGLFTPSYSYSVRLPGSTRKFYAQLIARGRIRDLRIVSVTARVEARPSL